MLAEGGGETLATRALCASRASRWHAIIHA